VPVVRTITDTTADKVRVTITVPQLVESKDNGDRVGATFDWAIDVQSAGGGFVRRWTDTVAGKATAPYSRAVVLELDPVGPPPWDIKVIRLTADSTTTNLVNAFVWSSYTVISGVQMLYRHSAVARLTFDAKNFTTIPTRWYDLVGLSDFDIPVNYEPLNRTVTGPWNGTFKQGWTNNPAWVLYNLVAHRRYGLGNYVVQLPDKWTLYQLAQWCDQAVPDGRGGTEPRYSINVWIIEQKDALRLLQDICSVFRGVLMHSGATLTTTWDAPGDPVASYAPANVVDGLFTYADGSNGAIRTSCTCWYTDRGQAGKRVPATWDDPDLVTRYGLRSMEIDPLGVSTPGQALRMAKWALYTAQYENSTVTFRVGNEGVVRQVGEVFQITDPGEAGERLGGRIRSATTTQVVLDDAVILASGETYSLWVTLPDPDDPTRLLHQQRTVTNSAGVASALNVSPAFSQAPLPDTVWVLEGTDVAPTLWRYVSINEVQGNEAGIEYEVMGVRHVPGKFELIEANQPLTIPPVRRLRVDAPRVTGLTINEVVWLDPEGASHSTVTVSWVPPFRGLRYVLSWRRDLGPWTQEPPTSASTLDFQDVQPGVYDVQVQSLNGRGMLSVPVTATAILLGAQGRPDNVAGLAFQIVPGGLRMSWAADTQPGYLKTRLSHGPDFASATLFWEGNSTDFVVRPPADGTYTVWAVHVNRRDVPSLVPSSIEVPYVAAAAGSDGLNNATVVLYQRSATAPAAPSAAVTYTFATGGVTGLTNGWLADIPTGTLPLWVIKAVASSTTPTDSIGTVEWQAPVILAQDGVAGANAPVVSLVADPMIFTTPANSTTPGPATTTISAISTNLPGATHAWTVDGVPQGTTGAALVLAAFAAGTRKQVTVVATSGANSATDTISIYSLREGSDAFNAGLDNESQNVTCDAAGTPSPAGQLPLTAQAYAVLGSAFVTSGVSYGIQAGSNSGFTSPSISASGAVSIAGMSADACSVIFTATRAGVTIPMRFTATKTRSGAAGTAGASTRNAYALYTGNPTVTGTTVTTTGPTSLPSVGDWSPTAATAWSSTTQTPSSGQALFMTVGTYDPGTNQTTWQVPFLANLKVGSLSAITANMGTLTAGSIDTSGAIRVGGSNGAISIFDVGSGAGVARTIGGIFNTSLNSAVAVYGKSNTGGVGAVYGENTSTAANSAGVFGLGRTGVMGQAVGAGDGVAGNSSATSGSAGVNGVSGGFNTYGVLARQGLSGGLALRAIGDATVDGLLQAGSLRINQGSSAGSGAWNLPNGGNPASGKPGASTTGVFVPLNMNGSPGWVLWWPNS
jgi:hypothetical protein